MIRPGRPADVYSCDCGPGGWSEVLWIENPKDGIRRPVYRCEGCGINRLNPEDLNTWDLIVPAFVERIGEVMEFAPPLSETIPGIVWSFGRKKRREFYFVRDMTYRDRAVIKGYFTPYPTAILLAATISIQRKLGEILPENLCFSMEAILEMDDSGHLTADLTSIEAEVVPAVKVQKKPVPRRGNRSANIAKLVHELEQHLIAARDHVWEVGNMLPRPSLQHLGKLAGLEKHDVTRCMKDTDAVKLRYLWKVADDIKLIRDWQR